MKKRILILCVAACIMLLAFGVINASAAKSGTCGTNLTWTLDDAGTLTISGRGNMDDWVNSPDIPWYSERENITKVVIKDGVTSIGDYAFRDCSSLASVTIGDSVTSIGYSAFRNCESIASITIPDSVTKIYNYAFSNCSSLKKVNITNMEAWFNIDFGSSGSNPMCNIGELYLNGNLVTNITIPDSVTSIGNSALRGCSSLASVTIGDSVTSIGSSAFRGCSSLASVTIGDSVTSIDIYAFEGCSSLASITIPGSVTSFGDCAFSNCSSLASVTIGDGVTSIGGYAFYGCDSLTSITIPDSVTSIGGYAFRGCSSLVSITIPDSVISIGSYAFRECSSLASITIPDSVTSIGSYAFYKCSSLASITIPDGVETIPVETFYRCGNLEYVCLPQGIKNIRNGAFDYCSNIKTVFYAGSEEEWNEILFNERNENLTNAKIVYNATKKTYKFETNCDAKLDDVTDYAIFTMPTVQNEGMSISGWYDNEALSGEPVSFPYYGDAKTLYASWIDGTGKNFDDAFVANPNQEYTVTTTESGQLVYFEFVPNLSKNYKFYTTGSNGTCGYLYNSNKSQIASNDDAGEGDNFYISYNLTAGQKYYIAAKVYSGTGTFTFVIEEPVDYRINEIAIKDMSGNSLGEIPKGTFLATVSFTNVSSSADTVIVLAQYTSKGAFKWLTFVQTEDVPTGSTKNLSIPVDNSEGDVAKLKAMCWESFGSQTPMGNSVTFPAE